MDKKLFHKRIRLVTHCYSDWIYDPRCYNKDVAILNHHSGGVVCLKPSCDDGLRTQRYVSLDTQKIKGLRYLGGSVCFSVLRQPKISNDSFKKGLFYKAFQSWDEFLALSSEDKQLELEHKINVKTFNHYCPAFNQRPLSRYIHRPHGSKFYLKINDTEIIANVVRGSDSINIEINSLDKNLAFKFLNVLKSRL